MGNENEFCPVSNLPVTQKSGWTEIPISGKYHVTFRMIGHRILHIIPRGYATEIDVDKLYFYREQVLKEVITPGEKFVEIRDYKNVMGTPSRKSRVAGIRYFKQEALRCCGFIAYNTSRAIHTLFDLGTKSQSVPYPFEILDNYENAVKRALTLLGQSNEQELSDQKNIVTRDEWKYEGEGFTVQYRVLGTKVVLSKFEGSMKMHHVERAINTIKNVYEKGRLGPYHYTVIDFHGAVSATWAARLKYIKLIKKLFNIYGSPKKVFIMGASRIVNTIMKLLREQVGSPMVFVENSEAALTLIKKLENPALHSLRATSKDEEHLPQNPYKKYEDEILNFIASFTWDEPGKKLKVFEENHPFKSVFDAISLVKMDIDELLKESNEARQEAEHANKARSRFLTYMSHEVRTPLNGILGMSTLLLNEDPTGKQRERLSDLKYSAQALTDIIDEMVDFPKMEAGKIKLSVAPFIISEMAQQVIHTVAIYANEKKINLKCTIEPGVPEALKGDQARMRQVLLNLVGNTIKFTHKGEVHLSLTKKKETPMAITLEFSVAGSGATANKTGEKGTKEHTTTTDNAITHLYGETDPGLNFAQNLVRLMGGIIKADSTDDMGSRFFFELTMKKVDKNKSLFSTSDDLVFDRKLTVLLAEDHPINIKLATRYLRLKGWEVLIAKNGLEAVRVYEENRDAIDVILMDIQMPVLDGYDATKRIRNLEKKEDHKRVPIIAFTALALEEFKERAFDSGVDDFITKPLKVGKLYETIHRLTQK
ncbi:MAG: response regulator [bacterium]|nr:response regulator [bacterium]